MQRARDRLAARQRRSAEGHAIDGVEGDHVQHAVLARQQPDDALDLVVTVDTEEEFDWSKPLDRTSHGLDHLPRLAKFQQFCESYGVAPVYLMDYPVVTDPRAAEVLGGAVAQGRAEIGVQLHPWVNPPFIEQVGVRNSYAGNLPPELERDGLDAAALHLVARRDDEVVGCCRLLPDDGDLPVHDFVAALPSSTILAVPSVMWGSLRC